MNGVKPGFLTSEFWAMMVPVLGLLLKTFLGIEVPSDQLTTGVLGAVSFIGLVAYIVSREKVKNAGK